MIVRTRHAGGRQVRASATYGSSSIPMPGSGYRSFAGNRVSVTSAMGLPAVSAAVRIVSETIGAMPLMVRDGNRRATQSAQYQLLHDRPNELPQSPFDFVTQIAMSIETQGNAFVQMIRSGNRVTELYVVDPDMVRVRRDAETGDKRFDVFIEGERVMDLTSADIIHIPGFSPAGSIVGFSPIQMHRHALGNNLAMQEFLGRYWSNDASPGLVIKVPGTVGGQQAKQILETWAANHGNGVHNAHKPAVLAGGAELEKIPINMRDAAYVEAARMGIEDIANIYRIPKHMLGVGEPVGNTAEQEMIRFYQTSLLPRIRRIEQGFNASALFEGTDLTPEFLIDGLLRADAETRYNNALKARQGGILTANELRALEGYPPLAGGDELQMTPVGGAPNAPGGADAAA